MNTLVRSFTFPALIMLAGLIFFTCTAPSQAQISSMIFPITPEDQDYLRYLQFELKVDSAQVIAFLGEYRLRNGNTTTRVHLNHVSACNSLTKGDSAQGEHLNLLPISRTENFSLPTSGVAYLDFFRDMTLHRIPNDGKGDGGMGHLGENGADGTGSYWMIEHGRWKDRVEFVTSLVRASDNKVLAVLDSIGTLPNPTSNSVMVYGTHPIQKKHSRALPSGYGGTLVYLQVSSRRFGPTPKGISLRQYCDVPWNYSSVVDSMGNAMLDRAAENSILVLEKRLLYSYYDSVISATGHFPKVTEQERLIIAPELSDSLYSRYYDRHYMQNGNVYYTEKDFAVEKHTKLYGRPTTKNSIVCANSMTIIQDASLQTIMPNPATNSAEVIINATLTITNCTLEIYPLAGKRIGRLWAGTLKKGINSITVDITGYANGTYGVYCNNSVGETIDFDKIIVSH